jgi:hypothetical protein
MNPELVDLVRHDFGDLFAGWTGSVPFVPTGPVQVSATAGAELVQAAEQLLRLATEAVLRIPGDPMARHRALGMDPRLLGLYQSATLEESYSSIFARPDVVRTKDGWRFLEFNVSCAVGGPVWVHRINELWRALGSSTASRFESPVAARTKLLQKIAAELGVEHRVAVIANLDERFADVRAEVEVGELRRGGFDAVFESPEDYLEADARGRSVPLVVREIVPQEWLDEHKSIESLIAIAKSGAAVVAPQTSYQVGNKQILAVLSAGGSWLTEAEQELVQRFVPWTRRFAGGDVVFRDEELSARRLLLDQQDVFVLKRPDGGRGNGVHLGLETPADVWAKLVDDAEAASNWVVQEAVFPAADAMTVQPIHGGSEAEISVPMIFGPMLVDGAVQGCLARFETTGDGTVFEHGTPAGMLNTCCWPDK